MGLVGFKGGHEKNMALKKKGFKGGGGGSFLNVILTFRKFKFYRGRMSQDPPSTLLCTKRQFYPSKTQKSIQAYQIERFIRKK